MVEVFYVFATRQKRGIRFDWWLVPGLFPLSRARPEPDPRPARQKMMTDLRDARRMSQTSVGVFMSFQANVLLQVYLVFEVNSHLNRLICLHSVTVDVSKHVRKTSYIR